MIETPDATAQPAEVSGGADRGAIGSRRHRTLVAAIALACLIAGVAIRFPGLAVPLTGIRDTQTASITRNLMHDGPSDLLAPRVNYPGDQPGYLAFEFPLFNAAQAVTARLAPWAGEAAFRLPSLFAFIVGALCLFDFASRRLGHNEACCAVALLAIIPVQISTSLASAPDLAAVTMALAALTLLDRYLDSNGRLTLVGFACALAAAALLKSPILVIVLPFAVLVAVRRGWRALWNPRLLAASCLAAVPLVAWMVHSRQLNAVSRLNWNVTAADLVDGYMAQRGRIDFYLDPGWYEAVGDKLTEAFTGVGLVIAVVGLVVAIGRRVPLFPVLVAWLVSLLVYVVALPLHLATHTYYALPFAPLVALLGAVFLAAVADLTILRRFSIGWFTVVILVLVVAQDVPGTMKKITVYPRCPVVFGITAQKKSAADDLIVAAKPGLRPWDGSLLYRADRRGWKLRLHPPRAAAKNIWPSGSSDAREADRGDVYWTERSIEELERMRRHGASVIGLLGSRRYLARTAPGFMAYLEENYARVAKLRCCVFYDLTRQPRKKSTVDGDELGNEPKPRVRRRDSPTPP